MNFIKPDIFNNNIYIYFVAVADIIGTSVCHVFKFQFVTTNITFIVSVVMRITFSSSIRIKYWYHTCQAKVVTEIYAPLP